VGRGAAVVAVPVSARFLSLAEREEIAAGRAGGATDRPAAGPGALDSEPGAGPHRAPGGYRAVAAARQAQARRDRPRPRWRPDPLAPM